jgi:hypothetical protein
MREDEEDSSESDSDSSVDGAEHINSGGAMGFINSGSSSNTDSKVYGKTTKKANKDLETPAKIGTLTKSLSSPASLWNKFEKERTDKAKAQAIGRMFDIEEGADGSENDSSNSSSDSSDREKEETYGSRRKRTESVHSQLSEGEILAKARAGRLSGIGGALENMIGFFTGSTSTKRNSGIVNSTPRNEPSMNELNNDSLSARINRLSGIKFVSNVSSVEEMTVKNENESAPIIASSSPGAEANHRKSIVGNLFTLLGIGGNSSAYSSTYNSADASGKHSDKLALGSSSARIIPDDNSSNDVQELSLSNSVSEADKLGDLVSRIRDSAGLIRDGICHINI